MQQTSSTLGKAPLKASMARLTFGKLTEAWKGEATHFTPLLAAQLDALGDAIGVDLTSLGESEVPTTGGRRIDIVAQDDGGSEFVVENQYGRADHDHLTRGLAYAVAREARGLVVVAEQHRDEFRAVARYLNDLAEHSPERGIAVWLVEAKAVRIEESMWAPLFTAVVQPNTFTATVEQAKQLETTVKTLDEFLAQVVNNALRDALTALESQWTAAGHRRRFGANHMVLMAKGPSVNGLRTVVAVFNDGAVMVPFGSYAGQNSGIAVSPLTTDSFRAGANELFNFSGSEKQARTSAGWLTPESVDALLGFAQEVSAAYKQALEETI